MSYDYLVVGAGFAGATIAERLAAVLGARVLVIDKRPHLGGNCYDPVGSDGLRRHLYGPHIFHTNAEHVVRYLGRFTKWRPYEHRVLARVGERLVPIPINRSTVNTLLGVALEAHQVADFFAARAIRSERIRNSEDAIVSRVGRELFDLLFVGYTRKHWGLEPRDLDASVCGRIPVRTNDDDRYFADRFQCMPADGYAALFERMLDHPRIDLALGTSYRSAADRETFRHVVYTGPIDEFFEYRFGRLPYRSLHIEFETVDGPFAQPAACINEPDERVPYTRITDHKYLTAQEHPRTVISREYPRDTGDPFYPIPRPENRVLYQRYERLASRTNHVTFLGRLAEYRYYNMDQAVASALVKFEELAKSARIAS